MPKRLEIRIILSLAIVLTAMIAVYGWWIGSLQSRIYIQSLSDNLQVLSHSHAESAAHYLIIGEYAGLEERMLEAASQPGVLGLQVVEPDGTLVCNVIRSDLTKPPRLLYRERALQLTNNGEEKIIRSGDHLVSWTQIEAGKPLGWLKLTLSLHTADELQRSTWLNTLWIGLLWILVGTALMFLVVRRPLRAIRELSHFAHDLQNRKGGQVSLSRGVYEIDLLADALNHSSVELKQREEQLVAQQEQLSVTLQSIGDGVLATDMDGKVMLLNHVAERLTGWKQEDAFNTRLQDVLRLDDDESLRRLGMVLIERRPVEIGDAVRLVSRTGESRLVTVNASPIIDSAGSLVGMVLVCSDVTDRAEMEAEKRKLEEQLIQSQKMESIGQLAGGIAHDFNNILTAITGYGEMLRARLGQDEKLAGYADQVLTSAGRAANLTRALLAFSRKQSIELQPADINTIVSGMQKLLTRLIGEDISLTARLADKPLRALVDTGQLEQILMNLATNARDAMPDGGELAISTDEVFIDELYSSSIPNGKPGRYALITVFDNGMGMDAETRTRIFEPFFTTKGVGKGTGLGLSIVYGIVRQHNGFVTVYSEPGQGTCFRIYIPMCESDVIEGGSAEKGENLCGSETILLAEDDNDTRTILALTLQESGYDVVSASCGDEALALFEEHHERIGLILMDVIMPNLNGKETYSRISEKHPGVRVIFMSGYTADIIQHKGIVDDGINFIHKPISKRQLLSKIRSVLAEPAPVS